MPDEKKPYIPPVIEDITLGAIADAIVEVRRLREQVTSLQAANTHEVERRRALERAAQYVLSNIPGFPGILDHLRAVLGMCPQCRALPGEFCRTETGVQLPSPHPERAQGA